MEAFNSKSQCKVDMSMHVIYPSWVVLIVKQSILKYYFMKVI